VVWWSGSGLQIRGYHGRMVIYDSTTGGYLAGPPPGAGFFRKLIWLFSPPKPYYPRPPTRTPEQIERLKAQVERIRLQQAAR
jgi:hypothetical protein